MIEQEEQFEALRRKWNETRLGDGSRGAGPPECFLEPKDQELPGEMVCLFVLFIYFFPHSLSLSWLRNAGFEPWYSLSREIVELKCSCLLP